MLIFAMGLIYNKYGDDHFRSILLQSKNADELVIASPFCFSDFSGFATDISNAGSINRITLITTLKNEEAHTKVSSLLSFRDEMERVGIEWRVLIDKSLHGKVYIFKKNANPISAVITSANLTNNGMRSNHEWGYMINDKEEITSLEIQILSDAKYELSSKTLEELNIRVKSINDEAPVTKPETIEIDDILFGTTVPEGKRFFIKPIGSLGAPVYDGDFSNEDMQFFSRRPNAVRVGDILIAYGVGSRKIISAFEVTSETLSTGNEKDRWKWYRMVKCLTPRLGKEWMNRSLYVMSIASQYYEKYSLLVTANGNNSLNGLKSHNDKIQLTDNFGRYLYSKVVAEDSI